LNKLQNFIGDLAIPIHHLYLLKDPVQLVHSPTYVTFISSKTRFNTMGQILLLGDFTKDHRSRLFNCAHKFFISLVFSALEEETGSFIFTNFISGLFFPKGQKIEATVSSTRSRPSEKRQALAKVASHAVQSSSASASCVTCVKGFISPIKEAEGYLFTLGPILGTTLGVLM
jgi:hypothetical protein